MIKMIKQRYSKWLEEKVFDMSKAQEEYLEKKGFKIHKPEEVKHDDGVIRDIPHYIERNDTDIVHLNWNRSVGRFVVTISKPISIQFEQIEEFKRLLTKFENMIQELGELQ
jgi:hypothetical protein